MVTITKRKGPEDCCKEREKAQGASSPERGLEPIPAAAVLVRRVVHLFTCTEPLRVRASNPGIRSGAVAHWKVGTSEWGSGDIKATVLSALEGL